MPNCTICSHPKLSEIDAALVASQSHRNVAKRFGLSAPSVYRHQKAHLPVLLVKAQEAAEIVQADSLLESIRALYARAFEILQKAEKAGQLETALRAIRELRGLLNCWRS